MKGAVSVRWLDGLDGGYDYAPPPGGDPRGSSDIALVLEPIAPPVWPRTSSPVSLALPTVEPTRIAFEPLRTRIERDRRPPARLILILKLDHLGRRRLPIDRPFGCTKPGTSPTETQRP